MEMCFIGSRKLSITRSAIMSHGMFQPNSFPFQKLSLLETGDGLHDDLVSYIAFQFLVR
jgi:hypothetical protein